MRRWLMLIVAALMACAPSPTGAPIGPSVSSTPAISGDLTVFAASSLTEAFGEMATAFQAANPGVKVVYNFGGSQQLRTQLEQGARADIFASANNEQLDAAIKGGVISAGAARPFAGNKLSIIVPKDNPARITAPADLARPGIKLVIAAKDVPVGGYARDAFTKMAADSRYGSDFAAKALANVVSEESNVRQVVAKVQIGEADAGLVYTTDVTPQAASAVSQIDIPDAFNVIANYPIAPLKAPVNAAAADRFIAFVLAPAGQAILKKYGFLPPA